MCWLCTLSWTTWLLGSGTQPHSQIPPRILGCPSYLLIKRPPQEGIIGAFHHHEEKRQMSSPPSAIAIQVDSQTHLVAVSACVEGWKCGKGPVRTGRQDTALPPAAHPQRGEDINNHSAFGKYQGRFSSQKNPQTSRQSCHAAQDSPQLQILLPYSLQKSY